MALATYVSMRPKRSSACSTTCATSSCTVQSAGTARPSEPNASISRTQASRASPFRAVTTTVAPRCAASRATARPRPLEAPVTTTTWSLRAFLRAIPTSVPENGLRYAHAEHRNRRDHPPAAPCAAALRREAAAGDRPFARIGHAGVQRVGQRQESRPARAPDDHTRADDRLAPRARDRLGGRHEASSAPPRARRGSNAGRAPRGAAATHLRLSRRAAPRLRPHLGLPHHRPRLAQPVPAEADAEAVHPRSRRAVPDGDEDLHLRRAATRPSRAALAAVVVPRAGDRRAPGAPHRRLRPDRRRPPRRRDRLRLLRRPAGRRPLLD